jgi:murein DD-endopeptidase MepM/ murein hydrolase activator NlpD
VDLWADRGTPVLAMYDGYAEAYETPKGGNVVLLSQPRGMAPAMEAYYAHLLPEGRVDGWVKAGDVIGYVGASGNATRPDGTALYHLHLAIGQIQPDGSGTIAPWGWLAEV